MESINIGAVLLFSFVGVPAVALTMLALYWMLRVGAWQRQHGVLRLWIMPTMAGMGFAAAWIAALICFGPFGRRFLVMESALLMELLFAGFVIPWRFITDVDSVKPALYKCRRVLLGISIITAILLGFFANNGGSEALTIPIIVIGLMNALIVNYLIFFNWYELPESNGTWKGLLICIGDSIMFLILLIGSLLYLYYFIYKDWQSLF